MRDRAGRLERWEQAGGEEDQWDVGLERQAGATFTLSSTLLILMACLLWAWFYSRYWGSERGQNTTILTVMDLQFRRKRKIISQLSKIGTMSDVNFSGEKNNVGKEDLKCLGWGRAWHFRYCSQGKTCWGDFRVKTRYLQEQHLGEREHEEASVA